MTKRPKRKMLNLAPEQSWWLDAGNEICPVCHQLYLYEMEYRCVDCDGPACANCVEIKRSLTIVCLPCFEPQAAFRVGVERR